MRGFVGKVRSRVFLEVKSISVSLVIPCDKNVLLVFGLMRVPARRNIGWAKSAMVGIAGRSLSRSHFSSGLSWACGKGEASSILTISAEGCLYCTTVCANAEAQISKKMAVQENRRKRMGVPPIPV